jgi:hypothetical protein
MGADFYKQMAPLEHSYGFAKAPQLGSLFVETKITI